MKGDCSMKCEINLPDHSGPVGRYVHFDGKTHHALCEWHASDLDVRPYTGGRLKCLGTAKNGNPCRQYTRGHRDYCPDHSYD